MITSKNQKWTPDGESFRQFHVIAGYPSDEDIRDRFAWRCHCGHDCCGHFFASVTSTRRLSGGRIAIRQHGWRNI